MFYHFKILTLPGYCYKINEILSFEMNTCILSTLLCGLFLIVEKQFKNTTKTILKYYN